MAPQALVTTTLYWEFISVPQRCGTAETMKSKSEEQTELKTPWGARAAEALHFQPKDQGWQRAFFW